MTNSSDPGEELADENDGMAGGEASATPSRRDLLTTVGAVAGAGALAGCPGEVTSQTFEATPVVLTGPGRDLYGLPEFELEKTSRTRSEGDVGEATIVDYLSVHSRPAEGEPPVEFGTRAPGHRRFGTLSTPAPAVVGEAVNPLATRPLSELVRGQRGRQFLQRTGIVETSEFDWTRRPEQVGTRQVELLGSTTEAQSYMGVAAGGENPTTLLMNLARVVTGGDAVLVGEFVRRLTPPNPIETYAECVYDLCQMPSPQQVDMWRRYKRSLEYLATCTELLTAKGTGIEVCGGVGGGGGGTATDSPTTSGPPPKIGITNARLVQHVEGTVVETPGGSRAHSEPDPDLVKGENTAVVFEFDQIENVDSLSGALELEVNPSNHRPRRFEVSRSDLESVKNSGEHTVSVLHNDATDGNSANDNPVFELGGNPSVMVETVSLGNNGFREKVTPTSGQSVVDLDTLTVGFIELEDGQNGSRYGKSNGEVRFFSRSFRSATEYLQRAYPGDVVAYGHRDRNVVGKANLFGHDRTIFKDMVRANRVLTRIAVDPSYPHNSAGFPNGGLLRTDGLSRSSMVNEIRNNGFDIVVAIVPRNDPNNGGATGYYDYHNRKVSGLAWSNPSAAVSALCTTNSGSDHGISSTVAQEVGHYFQDGYLNPSGHPMAQRRNKKNAFQKKVNGDQIHPAHARHQSSSLRGISSDPPGVVSTAYDLEGGFANMQSYRNPDGSFSVTGPGSGSSSINRVPSYMSYTGKNGQVWGDARIHQQLIDNEWDATGLFGSGSSAYMVSGIGHAADDGSVEYDEVSAFQGVASYLETDGAPVTVELLGPDGDVLERASVPFEIRSSHTADAHGEEPIEAPAFRLPFTERGVEVRTSYEGQPASMNPIERSVRDAVGDVRAEGFREGPETAREDIGAALDEVAAAMNQGAYGEAANTMDGAVRGRIQEHVVAYESLLGEPTIEELTALVDEMVRRLRGLAETSE
jgi:hypothetical protein